MDEFKSNEEFEEFLRNNKDIVLDEINSMQADDLARRLENRVNGKKFSTNEPQFRKFQELLRFLTRYLEADGGKFVDTSTPDDCETNGWVEFTCASLEFTSDDMKTFSKLLADVSHFDAYATTDGILHVTLEIPDVYKK